MRLARLILLLSAVAAVSTDFAAAADADAGRNIARQHCARCHVVDGDNLHAGISSTPSFMTIVSALPDWRERFETFYARRPHPVHVRVEGLPAPDETVTPPNATPFTVTLSDLEDLVAYAATLNEGR